MELNEYEKLLDRARSQIPEGAFDRGDRFKIPEAVSFVEGNRTIIRNFFEVVDILNRDVHEVLKYISGQLGTAGTIEGHRVVLQGKFSTESINESIRDYTNMYVICPVCHKPDTELRREGKTLFLVCHACGARTSVKLI